MKYSKEFKLECVKKYKNGEYIEDPPNVKHTPFHLQVLKWAHIFDSLGEVGLDPNRPTLSPEERMDLIRRVEDGESYTSVAYSSGILPDLLIKWHKIYMEKGIDGLKSLKRGRRPMSNKKPKTEKPVEEMSDKEKLKYYKEQLEYLEAENAYLKKLKALVQQKPNKK